jgi:hypothetical protein
MAKRAAQNAYAKAGIKPSDVQVVELHGNEILFFVEFGKCVLVREKGQTRDF